jgi:hypothetical protein
VVIPTGSAHTVAAVVGALRTVATVTRFGGNHESSRLRVDGAAQDAVEYLLHGFDGLRFEIVHPDDWRTRSHPADIALLGVARLVEQAALTMTEAVRSGTSALAPDVRDRLVNALVAAFPHAADLDLVFDLRIGDNPGIATHGRPLRSHYNNVVGEMLRSSDRFDRFVCGAVRENPHNAALSDVVATAFDRCETCRRKRVTCEKVR